MPMIPLYSRSCKHEEMNNSFCHLGLRLHLHKFGHFLDIRKTFRRHFQDLKQTGLTDQTFRNNTKMKFWSVALLASFCSAGPFSYGICQTGCNTIAVACYGGAGLTFGTVTAGAGIPAAAVACNTALGICMTACVAAGCAPII